MSIKRFVAPSMLFVLGGALLVQLPIAIADRTSAYEWFDPVIEVRHILMSDFVESPDIDAMQLAMIDGMIETLGDPYTVYVPPREEADFNKELRGTYVGIGAEVNIVDGLLTIVSPMDDSPALNAGILAGDVVLRIDDTPTLDLPIDDCIDLLMGKPETMVTMQVRHRDGVKEDLEVVRRRIITPTVKGLRRDGDEWSHCVDEARHLHYVRVTQFNSSTLGEFREVLDVLESTVIGGLIIDLRDNPGGALRTAVGMTDMFLSSGEIVSVRDRDGDGPTYSARDDGTRDDFPIVVLVNGHSASASEIVSGALQDHERARVLGTRTYGKGSVQEVRELDYDRGTLKFTSAYYHLPSGRNIQRRRGNVSDNLLWGVDPDPGLIVPVTDDEYVERIRARRQFEIIEGVEEGGDVCADATWIRENMLDEQLGRAVDVLAQRVATGTWPDTESDDSTIVALDEELSRALEWQVSLQQQLARIDERIQELTGAATSAGRESVLPEDVDMAEGTITLRDRDGNELGAFRIGGGNIAAALSTVRLERIE